MDNDDNNVRMPIIFYYIQYLYKIVMMTVQGITKMCTTTRRMYTL